MSDQPNRSPEIKQSGVDNTLRISQRDLEQLLDVLDDRTVDGAAVGREFVRWPFRVASIPLELFHPGGTVLKLPVAARNLASSGISVLHRTYVHTGSRCAVTLPHPHRGPCRVEGTVVRCSHVGGAVHELGIAFDCQLNAKEFVSLDPLTEAFSLERVDPTRIRGTLLLIDDSAVERKLIQRMLNDSNLRIRAAGSAEEAEEHSSEADLILCDFHLPSGGPELIESFREAGLLCPVVMMSSDPSVRAKERMRAAGVNGFLQKPLTAERVMRAMAEFLIASGDAGPLYSTLTESDAGAALVPEFVDNLRTMCEGFDEMIEGDDVDGARNACFKLIGSASTMGFDSIGHLATVTLRDIDATMSAKEAAPSIRRLVSECRRAKPKAA